MQMDNTDLQQKFVDGQSADSRSRTDRHKVHVRFFRSLPGDLSIASSTMFSPRSAI